VPGPAWLPPMGPISMMSGSPSQWSRADRPSRGSRRGGPRGRAPPRARRPVSPVAAITSEAIRSSCACQSHLLGYA
jgi:hypothetical protein